MNKKGIFLNKTEMIYKGTGHLYCALKRFIMQKTREGY